MNIEDANKFWNLINLRTTRALYIIQYSKRHGGDVSTLLQKELSKLQLIVNLATAGTLDYDNLPFNDADDVVIDDQTIVIDLDATHILNTNELSRLCQLKQERASQQERLDNMDRLIKKLTHNHSLGMFSIVQDPTQHHDTQQSSLDTGH